MKSVNCPCCGSPMRRNGRTSAGRQRWRCASCGASRTVRYDDAPARLDEFLGWLLSKGTQLGMPGGAGPSAGGPRSSGRCGPCRRPAASGIACSTSTTGGPAPTRGSGGQGGRCPRPATRLGRDERPAQGGAEEPQGARHLQAGEGRLKEPPVTCCLAYVMGMTHGLASDRRFHYQA